MTRLKESGFRALACAVMLLLTAGAGFRAEGQAASGYSEYYIPANEGTNTGTATQVGLWYILDNLDNAADPGPSNMHSVISVTAWAPTSTVYYDHWEDGLDFDPNNPATADETVVLATAGALRTFESANFTIPRPATTPGTGCNTVGTCVYDGGDRIFVAGATVTVTRAGWIESVGVGNQAVAWEIYPVAPQLTTYVLPFGENLSQYAFTRVYALVQATADNTTLQVDIDGNGTFDLLNANRNATKSAGDGDTATITLSAGQTFLLDRVSACPTNTTTCVTNPGTLNTGAVIQGNATLQVKFIAGNPGQNYCARGLSAFPRGYWTKSYYAPLGNPTAGSGTDYFLYNPHATALTVTWESRTATNSFSIPARSTVSFVAASGGAAPAGSGLYFSAPDVFWGVGLNDRTANVYEWGFSLLPTTLLYTEHFFGWAPGFIGGSGTARYDDDGAYLIPAQDNTRVFVDYNNDGTVDATYTLDRLQTQFISDPNDGDMSGARIWATGLFSLAYGENSDTASTSTPSLDLGYVAIPGTDFLSLVLGVEKSASPQIVPTASGSTTTFTIVGTTREYSLNGVSIVDTLPPSWEFVLDSAVITRPDLSTVSGAGANPTITGGGAILTWSAGQLVPSGMAPNQEVRVTFTGRTTAALTAGTLSQNRVLATGTRTVGSPAVTQTFSATNFAFVVSGSLEITKTSNAPTPLYPGDTFGYTVTVTNPAGGPTQTRVSLYDALPAGVTVVGTPTLSRSTVADSFNSASYTLNVGTRNWTGGWFEGLSGEGNPGNPATGEILITGGELALNNENLIGSGSDNRISRDIDLSSSGASSAFLAFRYRASAAVDADDDIRVEYSTNGGTSFTALATYSGAVSGTAGFTVPVANLRIRFIFPSNGDYSAADEDFFVDDLSITFDQSVATTLPPTLASGESLYSLGAGQSLTATFNVRVDDPFPAGPTLLTNTAATTTAQFPIQITASVTDQVTIPSVQSASVAGRVWLDANGDGVQDIGEPGLGNVEVTLKDQFGTPVATLTTNANGRYLFTGVTPGNGYYVEVASGLPAGVSQSYPIGRTDNRTASFNLAEGQSYTGADLGYEPQPGTVTFGDLTWVDADNDQLKDPGEIGLGGVRIRLYRDANADGFLAPLVDTLVGEPATGPGTMNVTNLSTTVTGVSTRFTTLAAGDPITIAGVTYSIASVTSDTQLTLGSVYTGPTATARPYTAGTAEGPGTVAATNGSATVTGTGTTFMGLEPGDPIVIRGVRYQVQTVTSDTELTLTSNFTGTTGAGLPSGLANATWSAADGSYLFTGAPATGAETYFVSASAPAGYISTTGSVSRFQGVTAGAVYLTADFGFRSSGTTYSISDRIWLDANADTVFDGGATEPGIGGVTVSLLDASLNVIGTTTTAGDGTFTFSGLAGGGADYTVRVSDALGVLADFTGTTTYATARERAEPNLSGDVDRRTAAAWPNGPSYGFLTTRAIGDSVYYDVNGNGTQDSGEAGFAGVPVSLYRDVNGDDTLSLSAKANVTATNGLATVTGAGFLNYHAGEPVMIAGALYTIQSVTNDTALILTSAYTGATGSQAFLAPTAGPGTVGVTNGSATVTGSGFLNYRAGEPITINNGATNVVYTILSIGSDTSLTLTTSYTGTTNGARTYYGPGDALLGSVTTDASGQFLFAGLPARDYVVSVPVPAGYNHIPGTRTDTDGTTPGIQLAATVSGSANVLDRDFGFQAPSAGGVQGTIWNDTDGNGTIGGTETGRFEGVTVEVLSGSTVVATLTTDASGFYSVGGLAVGSYTVRVTDTSGILTGTTATTSTSTSVSVIANTASTVDFGFRPPTPTYAAVAYLQAAISGGIVTVEWQTTQEVGTVGFHLLRLEPRSGNYTQVNEALLPGLLGHPEGGTYTFQDGGAPLSPPLTYKLVEVDAWGSRHEYGPWVIKAFGESGPPLDEKYRRTPGVIPADEQARIATLKMETVAVALASNRQKGSWVKFSTERAGLHFVDTATLAGRLGEKAGGLAKRIDSGGVVLENLGNVIPYLPAAGGVGLYFYAEAMESPFTDENVYWLAAQPGATMASSPGSPAGGTQAPTFLETVHAETDVYPLPAYFQDPLADFYAWDYLYAGYPGEDTRTMTTSLTGVAGTGQPTLTVCMHGGSDNGSPDEHRVRITWNGRDVGEMTWDGLVPHEVVIPLVASDVVEGVNTLVVTALLNQGLDYDVVFLDSFDVTYQRLYRAVNDELSFTVPAGAEATVTGFSSTAVLLLDVTTPSGPLLVTGATPFAARDNTFGLRFANSGATTRSYLAVLPARATLPATITPVQPAGLAASTNGADYILIAPASLLAAAESLAAYRRTQGLDTMVVDLEDVRDEFGFGLATPLAVSEFLAHATSTWIRSPQYVTLVGRGTFDYKNAQGIGDNNMPTLLFGTPYGLAASDVSFGTLTTGKRKGLKAIGRLPVLTSQELLDYVAKIQAHEAAPAAAWQKNLLLTADNPDGGGAFTADSDGVGAIAPAPFLSTKIYLTTYSPADARTAIRNSVNAGSLVFNYIGHGGPDRLTDENIFNKTDVPFLTNAGRLPVFLAMTCSSGNFGIPGFPSLSEALVLWKSGGAYVAWAPSGLSLNDGAVLMNEAFFHGAFVEGEKIVGRNCTSALEELDASGPMGYMKSIYNIIGEPVSRLP